MVASNYRRCDSYPLVYILGTIHPYGWMGLFDAAKMIQR